MSKCRAEIVSWMAAGSVRCNQSVAKWKPSPDTDTTHTHTTVTAAKMQLVLRIKQLLTGFWGCSGCFLPTSLFFQEVFRKKSLSFKEAAIALELSAKSCLPDYDQMFPLLLFILLTSILWLHCLLPSSSPLLVGDRCSGTCSHPSKVSDWLPFTSLTHLFF